MSPLWSNDGVDGGLVLCGGHAETVSRSQFQSRISLEEGLAAGGQGLCPRAHGEQHMGGPLALGLTVCPGPRSHCFL